MRLCGKGYKGWGRGERKVEMDIWAPQVDTVQ